MTISNQRDCEHDHQSTLINCFKSTVLINLEFEAHCVGLFGKQRKFLPNKHQLHHKTSIASQPHLPGAFDSLLIGVQQVEKVHQPVYRFGVFPVVYNQAVFVEGSGWRHCECRRLVDAFSQEDGSWRQI